MINLKLAELRRRNRLTQQELGDILSVSYQTISKWENGQVSPDINMLPQISAYFGVSVDALLGIVPLEQEYIPSDSGTIEYWSKRLSYLKNTRRNMWNEDYFEFLINYVWKIEKPIEILDCGCGYGALGLLLLPMLPKGSRYTGIDFARSMIDEAKSIFAGTEFDVTFIEEDILNFHTDKRYDVVISQAVLRHVNDGFSYLKKMVEFTRSDGIVVSIECNREFESCGLHIDGMDYSDLCMHDGLKKLWTTELEKQNRDYSIAMKIPHYMKRLGLYDVDCRMNDKVNILERNDKGYQERLESIIGADHWTDEKTEREVEADIEYFMNHGMSRLEAEQYCNQQNGIVGFMKEHRDNISLTKTMGLMISYGWKTAVKNVLV
ncbi:helix-turn-helix protein [Kineothrix alysoides]|uniref:Helix-turn-helix protein n=1 Tax=Kineothrix alysoides TaxID=1469948 RepID=A0A4R1QM21_9FIRM|nr:DNA (cytosine-5-)-methyltransferase [Kineothrix alysoides]TCL53811.1 helix-turn-helix protein [Kineothrix alysoides]